MDIGMLWYDSSKSDDLITKITRAAQYYHQKYGKTPDMCYVHPSNFGSNPADEEPRVLAGNIEVYPSVNVLPNHFWIGLKTN